MVTLRYRIVLPTTRPDSRSTKWRRVIGGASVALAAAEVINKLGSF
ncbi:hypothetical protein MDOR_33960 [Mycolicibacterium doricum]|jgi:hypothetical protein|uniref:Uncharacterized protein n=1 Tax=Mycolicibacterium doricum TaxID=126673 RepID=A0A7I7VWK6_9MYCO|nr:hypothetical protein [Mycolicibacterium doricum]BBZ09227.1 hypothetical protein MDOR_33960 [Mycolicibacterium doricum]